MAAARGTHRVEGVSRGRGRRTAFVAGSAGLVALTGIAGPSFATWNDEGPVLAAAMILSPEPDYEFEMWQATSLAPAWGNYESSDVANPVDFGPAARNMLPGDRRYAWVQLTTHYDSLGADVALSVDPIAAADTNAFTRHLVWRAATVADTDSCDAAGIAASSTVLEAGAALGTASPIIGTQPTFTLAAYGEDSVTVCFELFLDVDMTAPGAPAAADIMGKEARNVRWAFDAIGIEW